MLCVGLGAICGLSIRLGVLDALQVRGDSCTLIKVLVGFYLSLFMYMIS